MWGLGKKRTRLGKWLDRTGYSQEDLVEASGVNRNTISKACSDPDYEPGAKVMRKIMKAVRDIEPDKDASSFWDI
ncbi:Helix-turn-helix [Terribacillus aidingensis]|uniref:Helix-turn-helix n=1 Tax=Terribacillus aidingensis TaxID=586416 RepID=A0A285NZA3_9BACI|nr:helix-turn-helix transcriptional regulator [Terribacillus aidingensis]SNZ14538.1 Helix-turn-helix [Terribacillus aidingensis]